MTIHIPPNCVNTNSMKVSKLTEISYKTQNFRQLFLRKRCFNS